MWKGNLCYVVYTYGKCLRVSFTYGNTCVWARVIISLLETHTHTQREINYTYPVRFHSNANKIILKHSISTAITMTILQHIAGEFREQLRFLVSQRKMSLDGFRDFFSRRGPQRYSNSFRESHLNLYCRPFRQFSWNVSFSSINVQ